MTGMEGVCSTNRLVVGEDIREMGDRQFYKTL